MVDQIGQVQNFAHIPETQGNGQGHDIGHFIAMALFPGEFAFQDAPLLSAP
ncbi:hypothetical protein X474_03150 [Dethiosulfatarculus sandiegensis]|uniref:Uncharacterized protein n=1 Tax=Dethiosulfatarculus sandiegensis TaxID=1429043 RepID=A0A0D2JC94_9BACT|nr:hypothetical protein X474_03150 [Dethiosulfatarculus sandiegensis]